jgi:hypothetical protein
MERFEQENTEHDPGNLNKSESKSVFAKYKNVLLALVEIIKRERFQDRGEIKLNMPLGPFGELAGEYRGFFIHAKPPFKNIIYFPEPLYTGANIQHYYRKTSKRSSYSSRDESFEFQLSQLSILAKASGREEILPIGNYIGLVEYGNDGIRVIAQETTYSDSGRFWCSDASIGNVGHALYAAIEWWSTKLRRSERRKWISSNSFDEDTSWIDEAQDFYSDLEADGYVDDD